MLVKNMANAKFPSDYDRIEAELHHSQDSVEREMWDYLNECLRDIEWALSRSWTWGNYSFAPTASAARKTEYRLRERLARHFGPYFAEQHEPTPIPATQTKRRPIPYRVRTAVFERDEYRCVQCGNHLALQVDHIHPLARGGTDDFDNLQTLCGPCNASKGAR